MNRKVHLRELYDSMKVNSAFVVILPSSDYLCKPTASSETLPQPVSHLAEQVASGFGREIQYCVEENPHREIEFADREVDFQVFFER